MWQEFKELFEDDYIKVGKYKAVPFGPAWWIIRIGEVALGVAWGYVVYMGMWLILGGI